MLNFKKMSGDLKTSKEVLMAIVSLVGDDKLDIYDTCYQPGELMAPIIQQAFDLTSESQLIWCGKVYDRYVYARKEVVR